MLLFQIIHNVFLAYTLMLLVRIFGSWFPDFSQTRFMQFVSFYTDPYLNFFRNFIPPLGFLDISPIIAIFVLQLLEKGIYILAFQLL